MRRLFVFFMLVTFIASYSFAQTKEMKKVDASKAKVEKVAKDQKVKTSKKVEAAKTEKKAEVEKAVKKAEQIKAGALLKKTETPDLRFKENKGKAKKVVPEKKVFDEVN